MWKNQPPGKSSQFFHKVKPAHLWEPPPKQPMCHLLWNEGKYSLQFLIERLSFSTNHIKSIFLKKHEETIAQKGQKMPEDPTKTPTDQPSFSRNESRPSPEIRLRLDGAVLHARGSPACPRSCEAGLQWSKPIFQNNRCYCSYIYR